MSSKLEEVSILASFFVHDQLRLIMIKLKLTIFQANF